MKPSIVDVEARISKVVGSYTVADGELRGAVSEVSPKMTPRAQRVLKNRVGAIIGKTGATRDARVAGLIRLAYVRGIHLAAPEDHMSRGDMAAASVFADTLRQRIMAAEAAAVHNFEDSLRKTALLTTALRVRAANGNAQSFGDVLQAVGFVDRAGTRWGLAQYVTMATRTLAHEALTEGTLATMNRHGWDLVRVSHDDTSSPACLPWDGGLFSIEGNSAEAPPLEALPPFHPQCEHFLYREES